MSSPQEALPREENSDSDSDAESDASRQAGGKRKLSEKNNAITNPKGEKSLN